MSAECAICFLHIELEEECFLNTCYHRYHLQCARNWADSQQAHPSPDAAAPILTCPLCRAPYHAFITGTADGSSFRVHWLDKAAAEAAPHLGAQLQLSAAHSRRRSLYHQPLPTGHVGAPPSDAQAASGLSSAAAAPAVVVGPTTHRGRRPPWEPSHPEVERWSRRELQALLLQEDVTVVLAVALGALTAAPARSLSPPCPNAHPAPGQQQLQAAAPPTNQPNVNKRKLMTSGSFVLKRPRLAFAASAASVAPAQSSSAPALPTTAAPAAAPWQERLLDALTPYLGAMQAAQFTHELGSFMQAGLSIPAHDSLVFGVMAAREHAAENRQDGEGIVKRSQAEAGQGSESEGRGSEDDYRDWAPEADAEDV